MAKMSVQSSMFVVAVLSATSLLLLDVVKACSMPQGWRPRSDAEKLFDASDALYATVVRTTPDHRFDYGSSTTAYTAEVDVHCVLKGHETERIVNITEAGHVPGMCHSTNLTVGHQYVILVRRDSDGVYMPTSVQLRADSNKHIAKLMVACDLQQVYPIGVDPDTAPIKCPKSAPAGQCKNKKDFEAAAAAAGTPNNHDDDDDYYYDDNDDDDDVVRVGQSQNKAESRWSPLPFIVVSNCIAVTLWIIFNLNTVT